MNAVYIVAHHDVFHYIGQILAHGGACRVKIPFFPIPEKPFGFTSVGQ